MSNTLRKFQISSMCAYYAMESQYMENQLPMVCWLEPSCGVKNVKDCV